MLGADWFPNDTENGFGCALKEEYNEEADNLRSSRMLWLKENSQCKGDFEVSFCTKRNVTKWYERNRCVTSEYVNSSAGVDLSKLRKSLEK